MPRQAEVNVGSKIQISALHNDSLVSGIPFAAPGITGD